MEGSAGETGWGVGGSRMEAVGDVADVFEGPMEAAQDRGAASVVKSAKGSAVAHGLRGLEEVVEGEKYEGEGMVEEEDRNAGEEEGQMGEEEFQTEEGKAGGSEPLGK